MSNGGEFRTSLFGGFNKEDVRGYLQELERNAEVTKSEYQREIVGLKSKLQRAQEENETLEAEIQKYRAGLAEAEEKNLVDPMETKIHEEELEAQKKENEELRQAIAQLEAENFELQKAREEAAETVKEAEAIETDREEEYIKELELKKKEMEELQQKLEELQSENAALIQEKEKMLGELKGLKAANMETEKSCRLEEEIQQMQEQKEKYENDFKAITQVLEDARLSARHIEDEAQKKAEQILEEAKRESKEIIEGRKTQIDKELEDKGIRLMAAKYKIEAYRQELNLTQQKLYNLYSDMGKLVEGMPQRLEQLWEDEARFKIVQKEKKDESDDSVL